MFEDFLATKDTEIATRDVICTFPFQIMNKTMVMRNSETDDGGPENQVINYTPHNEVWGYILESEGKSCADNS